ncbi:MAG: tetraacyldisaccharide 4'-kinase [bacterium]|nr:tetraacyldisaccharide 4'-kinase [bacterium]MDT8365303.1 tetraacyldisaccharide 4'-kinase [bacterium]
MRSRFEAVLSDPPVYLLPFLIPLSAIYRGISSFHRYLYRSSVLTCHRLPRPVVSVGNLTIGGGGKTPLTMWLAENLMASGVKVAVLTRGYGRIHGGLRIVEERDTWEDVGDEPVLMASKIRGATVVVSRDRFAAGRKVLETRDVDLFLLDDGFQHFALDRDLDIVVVDGHRRFGNGRLLPAGILREPVSRLNDADLVVVTKAKQADPEFEGFLNRHSKASVFWADYRPLGLSLVSPGEPTVTGDRPDGLFVAFCGIAGPEGFRETLTRAGIEVVELLTFPDHHPYSASDINMIQETALRKEAVGLVTTEKDAARWNHPNLSLPLYSLSIHPVIEAEDDLLNTVLALVSKGGGAA